MLGHDHRAFHAVLQLTHIARPGIGLDRRQRTLAFGRRVWALLERWHAVNPPNTAGDELLRLLTSLISDEVRTDDIFGRFGGGEFLLILSGRSAGEAEMTAQKLLRLVRGHRFAGAGSQPLGKITISGGVAVFPEHAANRADLLMTADRARYRAKDKGRDRILIARHPSDEASVAPETGVYEMGEDDDLQKMYTTPWPLREGFKEFMAP